MVTAHVLATPQGVTFDCHGLLNDFYEQHVRLGRDRRAVLAAHRDANLERLSAGLAKLGPIAGADDPDFDEHLVQGSYAMHTLNQHPENDYDIDTGVIFLADTVPSDAKAARTRVARALREGGGNFAKPPRARTNAVTVWYAEGHHVDLAVYRRNGEHLEHAGGDTWNPCDPEEVPRWFRERNTALSPERAPHQLRRVVRWLKAFAKSRQTWNMPGGMIISALVAEVFRPNDERDDLALLDTLSALRDRLALSLRVANPVGGTLTGKQKYLDRVAFLRDKLKWLLPQLDVLRDPDCTLDDAKRAWRWMFNHSFWETPSRRAAVLAEAAQPLPLEMHAAVSRSKNGPLLYAHREQVALAKHLWIRFDLKDVPLSTADTVHWIVENSGAEAVAHDDLGHVTKDSSAVHWEGTAYAGTHRLIVEVRRGPVVLRRGVRIVTIS